MFKYRIYDFFRRTWWIDLPLTGVSFSDPISGGSALTGVLHVGDDVDEDQLRRYDQFLVKRRSWCIVTDCFTNEIIWHGVLVKRPWSLSSQSFNLEFQHPKEWWLGKRLRGTRKSTGTWSNSWDRMQLAREFIKGLYTPGNNDRMGMPRIVFGAEMAGKTMGYTLEPLAMKPVYTMIEEVAAGEDGYEWDLVAQWNPNDGRPEMRLAMWGPQISYPDIVSLTYSRTGHGNILSVPDEWPDDASDSYTRVLGVGGGEDGNKWGVVDTEPLAMREVYEELIVEKSVNYENITTPAQLIANTRAERLASQNNSGTIEIGVDLTRAKIADFPKGVRARLRIRDRFLDIDLPHVRVIERSFTDESRDSLAEMRLVLDINDYELPDGSPA